MNLVAKKIRGSLVVVFMTAIAGMLASGSVFALKADRAEFGLYIPYAHGDTLEFKGGAEIDFASDAGFGFGFGYNLNKNVAVRADIGWNSVSYDATRVYDDSSRETVGGRMDTFTLSFGGEYYLLTGKVAPYVLGNFGWATIDTNISNGNGGTVCWWDPWWGYVCDYYRSTYSDTSYYYSAGLGLRFDIGRNNYLKISYAENWTNIPKVTGDDRTNTTRVEFGFSY